LSTINIYPYYDDVSVLGNETLQTDRATDGEKWAHGGGGGGVVVEGNDDNKSQTHCLSKSSSESNNN
jgi:hypothetical protein